MQKKKYCEAQGDSRGMQQNGTNSVNKFKHNRASYREIHTWLYGVHFCDKVNICQKVHVLYMCVVKNVASAATCKAKEKTH